jgi:hypothetical protein
MEVLPLRHGIDLAGSSGHILEIRVEREESRYDSCPAISVQRRAAKSEFVCWSHLNRLTVVQDRLVKVCISPPGECLKIY